MANITVQIPDALVQRVQDAFAAEYMYQTEIPDPANPGQMIPNPETVNQFVQRQLREYLKGVVARHESMAASRDAEKKARDALG